MSGLIITLLGKGSEVLENLEKVAPLGKTLPIKFYDKYGVEMDRPRRSYPSRWRKRKRGSGELCRL